MWRREISKKEEEWALMQEPTFTRDLDKCIKKTKEKERKGEKVLTQ
jgi:hypothetical protein